LSSHAKYNIIKKKNFVFIVNHYAGEVEYDINGFLEKNKDTLENSVENAFSKSTNAIVAEIFGAKPVIDDSKDSKARLASSGATKKITLASQFKNQLAELLISLNAARPHFIRCVKPNAAKVANNFHGDMILKQLNYAGYSFTCFETQTLRLFEAVRIRATGFAYRKPHLQFFRNYKICVPEKLRKTLDDEKNFRGSEACQAILDTLSADLDFKDIKIGKTKVFFRANQLSALESCRSRAIQSTVLQIQAKIRGFLARKLYKRLKVCFILFSLSQFLGI